MRTTSFTLLASLGLATLGSGCGDMVRQGRGPSQVVISQLEAAPGADPDTTAGTLNSDVMTEGSIYDDRGIATMSLILKDPGSTDVATTPSLINQVTFTRYRVTYRRSDGRNTQGVDVPYAFDSAATFTVLTSGGGEVDFLLVRHIAKMEAPLRALRLSSEIIYTIAEVTFYGHDQAGNDVSVTGNIGVNFGDFADPD